MAYSSAFLIYEIGMLGKYGQTLGKMACNIVVLDVSESRLSFKQVALRDIFGIAVSVVDLAVNVPRIVQGREHNIGREHYEHGYDDGLFGNGGCEVCKR
jgi:hypothetical protein